MGDLERLANDSGESSHFLSDEKHNASYSTSRDLPSWSTYLWTKLIVCVVGILILLGLLTETIPSLLPSRPSVIKPTTLDEAHDLLPDAHTNGSCGSTVATARSRGCLFDPVEFSWLPPACIGTDRDAFMAVTEWKYWDAEHDEVLNTTAWLGESEYMRVTRRHHMVHCTFMWKRLHRAALLKEVTDSYVANFEHTKHCGEFLTTEYEDWNVVNAKLFVKFPTCGVRLDKEDLGVGQRDEVDDGKGE